MIKIETKNLNIIWFFLLLILIPFTSLAEDDKTGCIDVNVYGQKPETDEWRLFSTPCDVPTDWKISSVRPVSCLESKTYGKNPITQDWLTFSTPCDVPFEWESSTIKPNPDCPKQVIYGRNPDTKNWYTFSTPCDIPEGWTSLSAQPMNEDCSEIITYAQNPKTDNWYAFLTSCDVPTTWNNISTFPPDGFQESHSNLQVTYSSQEGELNIPLVFFKTLDEKTILYKKVKLDNIPVPNRELLFFFLSEFSGNKTTENGEVEK